MVDKRGPETPSYNTTLAAAATDLAGAPANYDYVIDAVYDVRDNNYEPNAVIGSVRTERALAKLVSGVSGDLNKLVRPAVLGGVPRLSSTKVPVDLAGAATADLVGQWDQVWVGLRNDLEITILSERYADTGEIGIVGWQRADVQIAQTDVFQIVDGIA